MIIMLPCWLKLRSFKVHAAMPKAGKKGRNKKCGSKIERRNQAGPAVVGGGCC